MSKPGFFFYPGDYIKDTRCLTPEGRGIYMDWLCVLFEHEGTVTWPVSALANYCGVTTETAIHVLHQLELTKVAEVEWLSTELSTAESDVTRKSQNDRKTIAKLSNRRMVRTAQHKEQIHMLRSEAGKKGNAKRWQKSQPSSSSSSSLNLNKNHKNDSLGIPLKRKTRTSYPENFFVTDSLREWCKENGCTAPEVTLEAFRDYHTAKGSLFLDWTAAFRNWVRNEKRFNAARGPRLVAPANHEPVKTIEQIWAESKARRAKEAEEARNRNGR